VGYTNWVPGRKDPFPTFLHDEDCVRMDFDKGGQWEDMTCSNDHGYVCEFNGMCMYVSDFFKDITLSYTAHSNGI